MFAASGRGPCLRPIRCLRPPAAALFRRCIRRGPLFAAAPGSVARRVLVRFNVTSMLRCGGVHVGRNKLRSGVPRRHVGTRKLAMRAERNTFQGLVPCAGLADFLTVLARARGGNGRRRRRDGRWRGRNRRGRRGCFGRGRGGRRRRRGGRCTCARCRRGIGLRRLAREAGEPRHREQEEEPCRPGPSARGGSSVLRGPARHGRRGIGGRGMDVFVVGVSDVVVSGPMAHVSAPWRATGSTKS